MKLETEKLHVSRSNKEVLSNVSFSVSAGEIYALLGGNGAGKSTTLLSFLGFLTPTRGSIRVSGAEVSQDVVKARKQIAYLPESAALYEHLNAYENLDYFLALADCTSSKQDIDLALNRVSLSEEARQNRLQNFSKGMRQKVAIALAILRDADILLLDEPTSGLDPGAIDEFHNLLRDLADNGKAILMVTHDVYGACQIANSVGLLHKGNFMGEFRAEAVGHIDTDAVRSAFASQNASLNNSPKFS